jgi:hypothetical protein
MFVKLLISPIKPSVLQVNFLIISHCIPWCSMHDQPFWCFFDGKWPTIIVAQGKTIGQRVVQYGDSKMGSKDFWIWFECCGISLFFAALALSRASTMWVGLYLLLLINKVEDEVMDLSSSQSWLKIRENLFSDLYRRKR